MALDRLTRNIACRFKQELEAALPGRVREVRIFGSRASGQARIDSDLDIFVRVDERDSALNDIVCSIADAVTDEFEGAIPISPRIMADAHFRDLLALERRLALDIVREGVPV